MAILVSVSQLLDRLEACASDVGGAMAESIVHDVAAIGAVARHDSGFRQRFTSHCEQHVRTLVQTARQGRVAHRGDLEFVREVGSRRAEDAFPIAALLDGLRVGHRVLSQRIAELAGSDPGAALSLTRHSIDYMDAASRVLTDSYLARQQLVIGRTDLVRRQLLDDLLEGRYASRADAPEVAAAQGFEPDRQYCVAVFIPTDEDMERERLAQVLAAEVNRAAFDHTSFRFVVVRRDEVVAILRAQVIAPVVGQALEAFRRRAANGARAGLSTACRGVIETPRGYWEAARALRVTSAEQPCVDLRELRLLNYLAASADSVAQRLAAQRVGTLSERLAETVLTYVDCDRNASVAAERLGVHVNTVRNRLERVASVMRRARMMPLDVVELATAIRICRAHDAQPFTAPADRPATI